MKKLLFIFAFSLAAALSFWSGADVKNASSRGPMAVTSTLGASSPTPLPTEFLTATPLPPPTATATPLPTATLAPSATLVVRPTSTGTAIPNVPSAPPVVLPALGDGDPDEGVLDRESPITRLVIPALGLDIPVQRVPFRDGHWDIAGLGNQAGWLETTSSPDFAGNTVLVGHLNLRGATGPFLNLAQLRPGDEILVYAHQQAYHYRVHVLSVIGPDDVSVTGQSTLPMLTLLTCYEPSWDAISRSYSLRQGVFASPAFDTK